MSDRVESHEHDGSDGPPDDRTGNNAVNIPETPGAPNPGGASRAPEPTGGASRAPEPTGDAPAPSEDPARSAPGDGPDQRPANDRDAAAGGPGGAGTRATARGGAAPDEAGGHTAGQEVPGPDAVDGFDVLDLGGDGLDGDELALRRMLHGAVEGLEPSSDALDHLRRAVPARRARKRQALVGAAAAVILLGTGVPAFVHVAASDGASGANPVNAGHGAAVQGGTGEHSGGLAGERAAGSPSGELDGSGKDGADPTRTPTSAGTSASDGADGTPDRQTSAPARPPACEAGQLGVSAPAVGAPAGDGAVYGTFRVTNVSTSDCVVGASGTVGFATGGSADPGRISVVRHTGGDGASGLPDPSAEVGSLVLKPSGAYEVRFAWVPSETCPVSGGGGSEGNGQSPEPTPPAPSEEPPPATGGTTADTAEGGTDSGTAAAEPQLARAEGAADGSVSVTYTPGAGGPQAVATVTGACVGTIYRTGLLLVE